MRLSYAEDGRHESKVFDIEDCTESRRKVSTLLRFKTWWDVSLLPKLYLRAKWTIRLKEIYLRDLRSIIIFVRCCAHAVRVGVVGQRCTYSDYVPYVLM